MLFQSLHRIPCGTSCRGQKRGKPLLSKRHPQIVLCTLLQGFRDGFVSRNASLKIDPEFTYDRNERVWDLRLAYSKERDYLYY